MLLNIRNNRKYVMTWAAQLTQETTKNKTAIMGREERVGVGEAVNKTENMYSPAFWKNHKD